MSALNDILNQYGKLGVQAFKQDVEKVNATGHTAQSIRYEVINKNESITMLTYYGRKFFSALETGRGPRKSSTDGGFKDNMLEYMKAKGIGTDLSEKKREQLAKFLVLKINREGDLTFKKGGRIVYTPTLTKLAKEVTKAVAENQAKAYTKLIINEFKRPTAA